MNIKTQKHNLFRSLLFVVILVGVFIYSGLYTVANNQRGIVFHFGKLARDSAGKVLVINPGLHLKLPLFSKVLKVVVARRLLEVNAQHVNLASHQYISLSYYIGWQVVDIDKYLEHFNADPKEARRVLRHMAVRELENYYMQVSVAKLLASRSSVVEEQVKQTLQKQFAGFGIEIDDFQITHMDLPPDFQANILQVMQRNYSNAIERIKANNTILLSRIRRQAVQIQKTILAEASLEAEQLRAAADSESASIFAEAYKDDPGLYKLQKSLDIYRKNLTDKNDILLLHYGDGLTSGALPSSVKN